NYAVSARNEQPQSRLMLAARITLPQLSISALNWVANSRGVRALRAVVGAAYFTRRYVNNVGGPPYEGAGLRIFSSSAVMDSTTCFRSVPFQFSDLSHSNSDPNCHRRDWCRIGPLRSPCTFRNRRSPPAPLLCPLPEWSASDCWMRTLSDRIER